MAEDCTSTSELFDVVLLGYGPVGATLSNLLTQQGLRVLVLEREPGIYHQARAGHFDAEVMRVFQSIGIADQVEATTEITLASRFIDADGALLMEHKRGVDKGPYGWVSDYMFFQPTLETQLRVRQQETGGAVVCLQHEAYAVQEHGDHAEVRAEDLRSGQLVSFRGRYVVGCDGARSLLRRTIGSAQEDLGFRQRWMVIDVKPRRDFGFEKASIHHCNPERPMYASVLGHGILRWEVMLKDTDDTAAVTSHDAIWNFIEGSVRPLSRNDGTITRNAVYTFESVLAHAWRRGRLLIAGDSAHRTPPFLGQGMCAGIRDAANLAWKLAAVCAGRAHDALLDSYAVERKPHVRAFILGAIEVGRVIQMSDPQELAARDRDLRANPKAFAPPDPPLGPGLSSSYGTDGTGRPFVQPMVDKRLLDEHIGHAFALVSGKTFLSAEDSACIQARYPLLKQIHLADHDAAHLEKQYGAPAALLRPDRYVHALPRTAKQVLAWLDELPVRLAMP